MKLIDQCSRLWGETPYTKEEAILWIEKAGRVCYRSEDKIIEGSGQKFVEGIVKRKHYSVIEHSNLVLRTKEKVKFPVNSLKVVQTVFNSKYFTFFIENDRVYISGNWRAWIEYYNATAPDYADMITLDNIHDVFACDIYEVVTNPDDIPTPLKAITVEFETNRAMTHELVRHRPVSYCLSHDTMIHHYGGRKNTIEKLYQYYDSRQKGNGRCNIIRLVGMDDDGELIPVKIKSVVRSGKKKLYKLITESGRSIESSENHRFNTPDGWKQLHELSVDDFVYSNGVDITREFIKQRYLDDNIERKILAKEIGMSDSWLGKKIACWGLQKPKSQQPNRGHGCGKKGMHTKEGLKRISNSKMGKNNPQYVDGIWKNGNRQCWSMYDIEGEKCHCGEDAEERHHIDGNPNNNDESNIDFLCIKCHKARHHDNAKVVFAERIVSIEYSRYDDTYDIEVDHECHNFVANGIIVHNSQESQRYCRYGALVFIKPLGYDDWTDLQKMVFKKSCEETEKWYNELLASGMSPQQARNILTNAVYTKIIMTCNLIEWNHIFSLRCAGGADPQMISLMTPVEKKFNSRGWVNYDK